MAINKITNEQRELMRQKSAQSLPDVPSSKGWTPKNFKDAMTKPLFDNENSFFAFYNALVEQIDNIKFDKEDYDFKNLGRFASEKEFATACETDYYSSSVQSKNFAYKGYIVDSANNQYTAFGLVGHRNSAGLSFDSMVLTQKGITCYQYGNEVPIVIPKVSSTEVNATTLETYNLKVQGTTEVPNPNSPKSAINQEYLQENYYNKDQVNTLTDEKYNEVKALIDAIVEDAPEMYDTLKEIADYIESDKSGASEMLSSINQNKEEIKEIKDTYAPKGYVDKRKNPLTKVTYDELVELRDNSQLVPGMQYQITDYETIFKSLHTKSAGHRFDIIVTADTENSLNETARATFHEGDTYFYREYETKSLKTGEVLYMYVDAGTEGYATHPSDIFVESDYKENNEGVVVPVIYKNDENYINEGAPADIADTFYFVDKYEYDGKIYDRWRKIENNNEESDDYFGWDDEGKVYALTNELVDASTMKFKDDIYYIKKEIKKVNIESWELKYSLDNDTTRFPNVSMENAIYILGEGEWFYYDGIFIYEDETIMHKWVNKDMYPNAFYITSSNNPTPEESVHWVYKNEENQEGIEFDYDTIHTTAQKGKGYIYYMKDEWNNEANYDFKNALHSFDVTDTDYEIVKEIRNLYTFCIELSKIQDVSVEQTFNHSIICVDNHIYSDDNVKIYTIPIIVLYSDNYYCQYKENSFYLSTFIYIQESIGASNNIKIKNSFDIVITDSLNVQLENCGRLIISYKYQEVKTVFENCENKDISFEKIFKGMDYASLLTIQHSINRYTDDRGALVCMIPTNDYYNTTSSTHYGLRTYSYDEEEKEWKEIDIVEA